MAFCYSNTIRRSCLFAQKMPRQCPDVSSALCSASPCRGCQPAFNRERKYLLFIELISNECEGIVLGDHYLLSRRLRGNFFLLEFHFVIPALKLKTRKSFNDVKKKKCKKMKSLFFRF